MNYTSAVQLVVPVQYSGLFDPPLKHRSPAVPERFPLAVVQFDSQIVIVPSFILGRKFVETAANPVISRPIPVPVVEPSIFIPRAPVFALNTLMRCPILA